MSGGETRDGVSLTNLDHPLEHLPAELGPAVRAAFSAYRDTATEADAEVQVPGPAARVL